MADLLQDQEFYGGGQDPGGIESVDRESHRTEISPLEYPGPTRACDQWRVEVSRGLSLEDTQGHLGNPASGPRNSSQAGLESQK